jgi:hypothetical protein
LKCQHPPNLRATSSLPFFHRADHVPHHFVERLVANDPTRKSVTSEHIVLDHQAAPPLCKHHAIRHDPDPVRSPYLSLKTALALVVLILRINLT